MAAIRERLIKVYGEETAGKYTEIIETMINNAQKKQKEQKKVKWDEKDVVLITYGDQIYKTGEKTLKTFDDFSKAPIPTTAI